MKKIFLLCLYFTMTQLSAQVTYTVNTVTDTDDGTCDVVHCSFREAINAANSDGVASNIHFNIVGNSPYMIMPSTQLPIIIKTVTIDATTQPDWELGDIVIDGSVVGSSHGLPIQNSGTTVKGLEIRNFGLNGILLSSGSAAIRIENNAIHSNSFYGINLPLNAIATILNNKIGTNRNNLSELGNGRSGINGSLQGSLIQDNVIVNNLEDGINIVSSGGNKIIDNEIGAFSTNNLGNSRNGVSISGATNDTIINNTIAYNQTVIDGFNNVGSVLIKENSVYCNDNAIVNLAVTAPTITTVLQSTITGTSFANARIEVFLSDTTNCSTAPCQGKTLLGTTTADGSGNWTLNAPYFASINLQSQVTATATNTSTNNTSGFATCVGVNNFECSGAFDLVVNSAACVGTTTTASTIGASSASPSPSGNCASTYGGRDIWFKAVLPFSGNMLVRKREGTSIQPVVEAYLGSCGNLTTIDCKSLETSPNVFIIDTTSNLAGSTVYFRVWDENNDNAGDVVLSAHFLPIDATQWEICNDTENDITNSSEGSSRRVANEFIIQYEQDTTGLDNNNRIFEESATLVKSCDCSIKTLQLWQTLTPDTVEIALDTATNLLNVAATNYNYIIGEQICTGLGKKERFPLFQYSYEPTPAAKNVRVAIIDTGVDTAHALLKTGFWQNPSVQAGCLPDDLIGYDFRNEVATPIDLDGHGTWVNGAIIRSFPSDIDLEMMNIKFKENDEGNLFDAVCGIYHAIEEQADLLVLSWNFKSNEFPTILFDALEEARKRGIMVFTAAGDILENNDFQAKYPGNFTLDNVVSVTSYESDLDGSNIRLGHYASFGQNTVDIAALGFVETTDLVLDEDEPFQLNSIASSTLATPLVARVAAIIKGNYPNLTYQYILDCIFDNADKHLSLKNQIKTEGILDEEQALLCAAEKSEAIENACTQSGLTISNSATIAASCNTPNGSIDISLSNVESPRFQWSNGEITEDLSDLYAGDYFLTVTDAAGCVIMEKVEVLQNCNSYQQAQMLETRASTGISSEYKVSPNPWSDELCINLESTETQEVELTLFDLSGQVVFQQKMLSVLEEAHSHCISIDLPKGAYILQIAEAKKIFQTKVIKM